MTVQMDNINGDWRIILIPEDDIERAIIKTKGGSLVQCVTDLKTVGQHIPDCLIISKNPVEQK